MALTDIVFQDGDLQNFILEMKRGNVGTITDIVSGNRVGYDSLMSYVVITPSSGSGAVYFAF